MSMKNVVLSIVLALALLGLGFFLGYRYGSPGYRLSPMASVESQVDGAHFELTYSRPYARSRVVFGEVVRFGRVWRTGANEATEIEFDRAIRFDSDSGPIEVPAGRYSLFTLPGQSDWLLILNRQTGMWGTQYDSAQDVARIPMVVRTNDHTEQLTVKVESIGDKGPGGELTASTETRGEISVAWETTLATAAFEVL